MQQYRDARFTAIVYADSQGYEPFALETDTFGQALGYVAECANARDYGKVIDNRLRRTVLRVNSREHWGRERVKLVLREIAARQSQPGVSI